MIERMTNTQIAEERQALTQKVAERGAVVFHHASWDRAELFAWLERLDQLYRFSALLAAVDTWEITDFPGPDGPASLYAATVVYTARPARPPAIPDDAVCSPLLAAALRGEAEAGAGRDPGAAYVQLVALLQALRVRPYPRP